MRSIGAFEKSRKEDYADAGSRRWPSPMPIIFAFCRTAPSVLFMVLAIFDTLLAFE